MFSRSESVRAISACILAIVFAVPENVLAETPHVVSPSDLQKQAVAATQAREQNVQKVRIFLSGPVAEQAMQKARIDAGRVRNAVANLNDQELAQLAARADKAQHDFAAGYLTTRDIALIILAVAVIILIIVVAT
jgi:hypothetical protein